MLSTGLDRGYGLVRRGRGLGYDVVCRGRKRDLILVRRGRRGRRRCHDHRCRVCPVRAAVVSTQPRALVPRPSRSIPAP